MPGFQNVVVRETALDGLSVTWVPQFDACCDEGGERDVAGQRKPWKTYFTTPVAGVLAVDKEAVVRWTLKTLLAVPAGIEMSLVFARRFPDPGVGPKTKSPYHVMF